MGSDKSRESRIEKIMASVREVPDFPKPGISFKDITTLLQDGPLFRDAIELLSEEVSQYEFDYIVSIEARGFVIGASVATLLGCGLVLVRKPGKLPYETKQIEYDLEYGTDTLEIHKDGVEMGDKVLLIDDVLATGGTMAATKTLIENLGGTSVAASFLAELSFLNGRDKLGDLPIHSLVVY